MKKVTAALRPLRVSTTKRTYRQPSALQCQALRTARPPSHRFSTSGQSRQQAADDPEFVSPLDAPSTIVRQRRRHGPGLIVLAIIPLTALALGTWQVQRLRWKSDLIAKCEDRIVRPPLPLPPRIDDSALEDFDYRRVYATGHYRHDQEMLVGPRMRDGEEGYQVVTPLEREGERASTILVNRGWISKKMRRQADRPGSLPQGEVKVEGLLREKWKRNMFTPLNRPDISEFYFPDVEQMAALTGAQPVWVEQTMEPGLLQALDMEATGIPIGRPAEVNLRNNHAQYIVTWYGLAAATSIMFWMVVRKPPSEIARRARMTRTF